MKVNFEELARIAKPISQDDWGSERQIQAQNRFCIAVEKVLSAKAFDELESYWLKANSEEGIDYAMELLRKEGKA